MDNNHNNHNSTNQETNKKLTDQSNIYGLADPKDYSCNGKKYYKVKISCEVLIVAKDKKLQEIQSEALKFLTQDSPTVSIKYKINEVYY